MYIYIYIYIYIQLLLLQRHHALVGPGEPVLEEAISAPKKKHNRTLTIILAIF